MDQQETERALNIARSLVKAGVPVFVAPPDPTTSTGFRLPMKWDTSTPVVEVVNRWRPGWALCAVMGHAVDLVDVDPRNGGDVSVDQLKGASAWPRSYGRAATPSGGTHDFIAPLRVGSHDNIAAGIDVKGGMPDGTSRGFAFIAPTVRISKVTKQPEPYRWLVEPDLDALAEFADADDSGGTVGEMVTKARGRGSAKTTPGEPFDGAEFWAESPWADIDNALKGSRRQGVFRLAASLRARGGWRLDDVLRYMRAMVWPRIDQGQGGHPYPADEFETDIRNAWARYADGHERDPYRDIPDDDDGGSEDQVAGAFDREVRAEAHRMRVRAAAKERVAAEEHAARWKAPVSFGSLEEELALPDSTVEWRIKGMLASGHNAIIVAKRKAGKTTVIGNLVRSLVDGDPFLGRFDVTRSDGAVAIFNYEVDQQQYRSWLRETGIGNTDRVHVLHLRGKTLPLRDDRVRAWVIDWLRERNIRQWIVDPYSRAYVGSVDNGNDEAKVGAFLDTLDVIKAEAGVSELIMPVHSPKAKVDAGEESAIGSQRLEGWPDALWYLVKDTETGLRFLRAEGRDIDVAEEQLTYSEAHRGLKLGGWDRATTAKKGDADAVLRYVTENPGCSQNSIQQHLGWGVTRVTNAIRAAGSCIQKAPGPNRSTLHYASGAPVFRGAPADSEHPSGGGAPTK